MDITQNQIQYCCLNEQEVYHKLYQEAQNDAYTAYWRGTRCCTEKDFFHEASASFQFPYYFGENWPALDECITDLEWIKFSRIFLFIDNFDKMFRGNTSTQQLLIKHLEMWINEWKTQNVAFEVWANRSGK